MFPGGVSGEQYRWLKTRLGTNSDNEASRLTQISANTVKRWKRNAGFSAILDTIKSDKLSAFRLLSITLSERVLDALEKLLASDKGVDLKAGISAWWAIFRLDIEGQTEEQTIPQQVFNILNIKGDVPPTVLNLVNPLKQLPVPTVKDVDINGS